MAKRKLRAILHKQKRELPTSSSSSSHPSGLLQHPGGAHKSGLRLGKDGNSTVGRMIRDEAVHEAQLGHGKLL